MGNGLLPLVAGNWKMNGLQSALDEVRAISAAASAGEAGAAEVVICPPATLLIAANEICRGTPVRLGGQDCHYDPSGPFTGEVSAEMLADAGAAYVILGHSERRAGFGETDETVNTKTRSAFRAGLTPIICVGETQAKREAGEALAVVGGQLKGSVPSSPEGGSLVIAYEPVWAIGTGLTPTPGDIAEMHNFIRTELVRDLGARGADVRILYGGSVKPENAADLVTIPEVNGVLVGGASLKSADFLRILAAYKRG